MPISANELKMYRSAVVSDGPTNGGVMSNTEIISGVSANLFPNASSQDRSAGKTQYRKLFMKVANASDLPLINPRIWQDTNTVGQDKVTFFAASQSGVQSAITGVEFQFGCGLLAVGVTIGSNSIQVEVEDAAVEVFANGGMIRISDRDTPTSPGNEVWATVQGMSAIGNIVTLTLVDPMPIGFLSGAKVSSVYQPGTVQAGMTGAVASSAGGSLVDSTTNLKVTSIGSISQTWTLTFTSATAYDVVGSTVGPVGSGNISSTFQPSNPNFAAYYFRIFPQLFSGTFAPGDTITFSTVPAAVPIWVRRVIPAGCAAVGNNQVALYIDGETQ